MSAFLEACLAPPNLVLSILLIACFLYWMMVIIGALAMDSLDPDIGGGGADIDADVDADIDVDADVGVDAELDADADVDGDAGLSTEHGGSAAVGLGLSVLKFFNVGEVPLLVLLSLIIGAAWAVGVLSYPIFGGWAVILQVLLFIPLVLIGMLVAKVVSTPLKVIYRQLREEELKEQHLNLIGKRCRVTSYSVTREGGQAEFQTDGAPYLLNVQTAQDNEVLKKGDEAVIVSRDREKGIYFIRGFQLEAET